jgi:hypothetical protein
VFSEGKLLVDSISDIDLHISGGLGYDRSPVYFGRQYHALPCLCGEEVSNKFSVSKNDIKTWCSKNSRVHV